MADQDKDLPLVVSEILIEMHGINDRLGSVENVLLQVAANIQQTNTAIARAAEVQAKQQETANANFKALMEADERNMAMLAGVFQQAMGTLSQRLERIENRLEGLETKQ